MIFVPIITVHSPCTSFYSRWLLVPWRSFHVCSTVELLLDKNLRSRNVGCFRVLAFFFRRQEFGPRSDIPRNHDSSHDDHADNGFWAGLFTCSVLCEGAWLVPYRVLFAGICFIRWICCRQLQKQASLQTKECRYLFRTIMTKSITDQSIYFTDNL